ncbi:hypothetical protein [Frankia tisae]|uniref:hypothetical protein n=1 Tax=Frankia tisae TaxID=2950104 RepID=UPI0021C0339A|nr:hypothetical protein [Frankia tisae]
MADLVDARWIDAPEVANAVADLRVVTGEPRFRAQLRYDGADVASLLALIAAGHGLGLLPRLRLAPGRPLAPAGGGDRHHDRHDGDRDGSGAFRADLVGMPPVGAAPELRAELLWTGRPGPAALALTRALGG